MFSVATRVRDLSFLQVVKTSQDGLNVFGQFPGSAGDQQLFHGELRKTNMGVSPFLFICLYLSRSSDKSNDRKQYQNMAEGPLYFSQLIPQLIQFNKKFDFSGLIKRLVCKTFAVGVSLLAISTFDSGIWLVRLYNISKQLLEI